MRFEWPAGFERIPDAPWTRQELGELALKYDTVENHGWYQNLDPTVEQLDHTLKPGDVLIDYSGGTGILADRLLARIGERAVGIAIVDSSPKFLRLALDKLGADERMAFRLIEWVEAQKRLQLLDEVLGAPLLARKADAIVSTNAIHLYYDLEETLRSWARSVKPRGAVLVQSGNIGHGRDIEGWIIDETIDAINAAARHIVESGDRFEDFRDALDDPKRMAAHETLRRKFFPPVRPLDFYLKSMSEAGIKVLEAKTRSIQAKVDDWYQFLSVYHEGVLGWAGGSERIEGSAPSDETVEQRKELMRLAMDLVFGGQRAFTCAWTYLIAEVRA